MALPKQRRRPLSVEVLGEKSFLSLHQPNRKSTWNKPTNAAFAVRKWSVTLVWRVIVVLSLSLVMFVSWYSVNQTVKSTTTTSSTSLLTKEFPIPPSPKRRFPQYGSDTFWKICPWIKHDNRVDMNDRLTRQHQTLKRQDATTVHNKGYDNSLSCITYVTPQPNENEGVAEWVSKIVSGFIDAQIRQCQLLLDYGPSIQLDQVVWPVDSFMDWRVQPHNATTTTTTTSNDSGVLFECLPSSQQQCYSFAKRISHNILTPRQWELKSLLLQPSGIHIPNYRHVYRNMTQIYNLHTDQFQDLIHFDFIKNNSHPNNHNDNHDMLVQHLSSSTSSFQLETGFACSMAATFQLANPQASQYQSNLFQELIPILRQEHSYTITIYVRSGDTDRKATAEKQQQAAMTTTTTTTTNVETKGQVKKDNTFQSTTTNFETNFEIQSTLQCVHQIEQEILEWMQQQNLDTTKKTNGTLQVPLNSPYSEQAHLKGNNTAASNIYFSGITWMIVSDSVPLKTWIQNHYDNQEISLVMQSSNDAKSIPTSFLHRRHHRRRVVSTTSQGIHTRAARNPQTIDFAEAMIDWFLMGEADVMVVSSRDYTFGTTAALRTALPIYHGMDCTRLPLVQSGTAPTRTFLPNKKKSNRIKIP